MPHPPGNQKKRQFAEASQPHRTHDQRLARTYPIFPRNATRRTSPRSAVSPCGAQSGSASDIAAPEVRVRLLNHAAQNNKEKLLERQRTRPRSPLKPSEDTFRRVVQSTRAAEKNPPRFGQASSSQPTIMPTGRRPQSVIL